MNWVRSLAVIVALLCAAPPSWAVPALDQQTSIQTLTNDTVDRNFSFAVLPAPGSLVVVTGWAACTGGWDNATPIIDNQNNTYTVVKTALVASGRAFVVYATNVNSTGTFTLTLDWNGTGCAGIYGSVRGSSFTGIVTTSPVDKSATATDPGPQAADASISTGTATTQNDELVVVSALICNSTANENIGTATTGYTNIQVQQDCSSQEAGSADYKIVSLIGTQTANWAHDDVTGSGSFDGWGTVIVTFKAVVAASAPVQAPPIFFQ